MSKTVLFKNNCLWSIAVFFFLSQSVSAQLADFSFTVTKTDETCTGNGTLTFATANTTPGATMIYSVYLLPETTVPIAVLSGTTITGLSAGTYRVVALQTLGNESNSQQQDVVITNQIVPLTFTVTGTPESCGDGSIIVTAEGNAATYELISGPVIVPPQTSNVFNNIPSGTYNVRVTDACGDAYVQTYTLLGTSYLIVSNFEPRCQMIDCDTSVVTFVVKTDIIGQPNMEIVYPLNIVITIHPPGNAPPIIITQTVASGDDHLQLITSQIPYFNNQAYVCDIAVSDSCGHTFYSNGNAILQEMTATVEPILGGENGLTINVCRGMPPFTVTFTGAPPGFNPIDHNPGHPGPFYTLPIEYVSTPGHEMPDGEYEVVVTDSCGNSGDGGASVVACPASYLINTVCPRNGIFMSPDTGGTPLATAIITEAPPGFPEPLPYNITFMITAEGYLTINLPAGHYVIEGMTTCPKPYRFTFTILEPFIEAEGKNDEGCLSTTGSVELSLNEGTYMTSIIIVQAPAGFVQLLPYDASGFIGAAPNSATITGLMYGEYVLNITDSCGNNYVVNVVVPLIISDQEPYMNSLPGCGIGMGTISLTSYNHELEQVIITGAPAGYPSPLPHDVSNAIASSGVFTLGGLPEGTYTFHTKDMCGKEHDFVRTLTGYHIITNEFEVLGHCGSFDLHLSYSPVIAYAQSFWLQKLNPVTNLWCHPLTGAVYPGGMPDNTSAYRLENDAINYNIATMGHFRVLRANLVYMTGSGGLEVCTETISEFDFNALLKISSAYSVPCSNGISQVIVIAGETSPLRYRITQKDGQPFLVENGNSNLFAGLGPGIYNFQVEDDCGNIANRLFDIISLAEPEITAHNLCNGQNGYLGVQGISYLSYQWWNGNDPATILTTSSSLYFSPFSQATTPGTYYVRIYSTTSLSCIDTTISYTIPTASAPNAGQDNSIEMCGSNTSIDLFTLLGGTFDNNGFWLEDTSSGMLTGHSWLPVGIPAGVYIFRYHVNGFCTDSDEALVTIDYKGPAPIPGIKIEQAFCSGGAIQLLADTVLNASYHWTGPDNFSSNEQNPVIQNSSSVNNGTYTLTVRLDQCEASSSAEITVNVAPDFTLANACQGGSYVLKAEPVANSFNVNEVSYSWTGPQNFSSATNPVNITGLPSGTYALTITTDEGCTVSKTMNVSSTRCSIPSGISPNYDGDNDFLDLTGYGILKFKIYNRYGRMVFEQDDYTNQWHGQDFNGRELPDATYYFYIRMNTGEEKTGWIYVTK